jgi:DNA modification methylase
MTAHVIRADARALPLPDASVDLILTSPPYFALRSYTDGGTHYAGQIGSEATPAEYIAALIACTREWMRVLKPTGSLFVNLGDTYASKANVGASVGATSRADRAEVIPKRRNTTASAPYKSLLMLPERYRIACVDQLGLIARAVVVWDKPNGLPESVTDRVRRSHEDWVHLTKLPRYFAAVDEIREEFADARPRAGMTWEKRKQRGDAMRQGEQAGTFGGNGLAGNPLGKLPGSVWEIASEPLKVPAELGVDHFAAFPMEWPRRLIKGWSPSGICVECGEGRRPVAERIADGRARSTTTARDPQWQSIQRADWQEGVRRVITGEACACPEPTAPTRPAVVLDPFGGTGTTALVASALGRTGISVDMSADYCRIAEWRTTDPAQRAKALGVDKPPAQLPGQADLLALFDAP